MNERNGNQGGIVLFGSHENDLGENKCNSSAIGIYLFSEAHQNRIGSNDKADNNGEFGIRVAANSHNNTFKKRGRGNGICD